MDDPAVIRRLEVFDVELPVVRPMGPASTTYTTRSAVLVRIEDADGVVGWGETYRRPGTAAVLAEATRGLVGQRAAGPRPLLDRLSGIPDRFGLSAIAIALDDLNGRRLGVSVADLYGGALRDSVRAYASSGGYPVDAELEDSWASETVAAVSDGFTACKIRIGRYAPSREMPALEKVRTLVGPGVDLMVDANGAYVAPTARSVARTLSDLDFRWFEEPLPRFHAGLEYPGYERLADVGVPIAAGEGLQTRSAFSALLARRAVDVVQPDVAICGGIREALFMADLAALSGRPCVPHAWGGAIQIAATLQAICLLPEPSEVSGSDWLLLEFDRFENPLRTRMCADPILPVGGLVRRPRGPGLGVTVDEEWLRRSCTVIAVEGI